MKQRRLPYLSLLNVLSCFSVVALHNNIFWEHPDGSLWILVNFIESFFYFAVPVFFMITGATLMEYSERYSTKVFFANRAKKTLIPFLFWSFVAAAWYMFRQFSAGQFSLPSLSEFVDGIVNARYMSIYWFFIPLFSIYLSLPALTRITEKLSVCRYLTFLGVLFVSVLPPLLPLLGIAQNPNLVPPIVGGYLLFPVMGYYLSRQEFSPAQRCFVYLLGLAGLLTHLLGTHFLSADEINQTFKGYTNFPSVFWAAAVFLFVRYLPVPVRLDSVLQWFEKRTFGIYLIHYYVIGVFARLLGANRAHPLWLTLGTVLVFLVSSGLVYLMQKIPLFRRLVP